MGKFDGVSDEELIARLRAGETAIEDYLMENIRGWCVRKPGPCSSSEEIQMT